jgi:diaminopimelate decarboxylase
LPVSNPGAERSGVVSIAGPYCESGDILIENLPMPDVKVGDLLAIPAAGAYQLSMSSNYNGSRRPAVLMLEDGKANLIQRRETVEDLMWRDV